MLYGVGVIGGIVWLVLYVVDLVYEVVNVFGGVSMMWFGVVGGDFVGMVNVLIVWDMLGVCVVGYWVCEGGYIDDVCWGLCDINDVIIIGGCFDVWVVLGGGWMIDVGIVV